MNYHDKNAFTLDELDENLALEYLRLYGICVVRNYAAGLRLETLRKFHDLALDENYLMKARFSLKSDPNAVARVKTKDLNVTHSDVLQIFNDARIDTICMEYFGKGYELNDEIFCTHERESELSILPWHFDREQSLKFYINLVDVDSTNGAFEYCPGSHREGRFRVNYYTAIGVHLGDMPNDIPDNEIISPVTVSASAGDLIIFDADGFHRGGVVSAGKERKVIRGHSHPLPRRRYRPRFFDTNWWLASPINFSKILAKRSGRILSKAARSAESRTRDY